LDAPKSSVTAFIKPTSGTRFTAGFFLRRPVEIAADSCQLETLIHHYLTDRLQAYSVEKLRITTIRKIKVIFHSPGARIRSQLCSSKLRQAGFSYDYCYPLVHTVRNAAHIANKIAEHFKIEFFNRIEGEADYRNLLFRRRLTTACGQHRPLAVTLTRQKRNPRWRGFLILVY
jgi:hypothetical protein